MANQKTEAGKTLTEIAQMRGTSREAAVRMRDRRAIQPVGIRGRAALYDPKEFDEKKPSASEQQSADYRRRYEKARAEKIEIDNARKRGDLIDRSLVAQVFGEVYGIHRSILLNIGPGLADTIASILEAGEADRTLKIQKLIDDEIYQALAAIKATINKFLRRIGAGEIEDDLPEPKPKTKVKPAAKRKKKPAD